MKTSENDRVDHLLNHNQLIQMSYEDIIQKMDTRKKLCDLQESSNFFVITVFYRIEPVISKEISLKR